jgi:hypothetical protein
MSSITKRAEMEEIHVIQGLLLSEFDMAIADG